MPGSSINADPLMTRWKITRGVGNVESLECVALPCGICGMCGVAVPCGICGMCGIPMWNAIKEDTIDKYLVCMHV